MPEPIVNREFAEDIKSKTTDYDRKFRKRIRIDVADMQIALQDFKQNVIRRNFTTPALGLIGAWLPLFSSDFKPILGYSVEEVRGFYIGIVICITFAILKTWIWPLQISFWKKNAELDGADRIVTADPKKLSQILHDKGDEA